MAGKTQTDAVKPAKVTHDVTGDRDVTDAVARRKQLKEYEKQVEAELKEIDEKLSVRMAEHDADALTQDGVTVAYRVEFTRETLSAKEVKAAHPRLFARFVNRTPVSYIKTS